MAGRASKSEPPENYANLKQAAQDIKLTREEKAYIDEPYTPSEIVSSTATVIM